MGNCPETEEFWTLLSRHLTEGNLRNPLYKDPRVQ